MAGRAEIRAIGPSYQLADKRTACQRSVNLYMAQVEGLGEARQVILESAPGFASYLTMPGNVRGMRNVEGTLYVVAGTNLYSVSGGAYTLRGSGIAGAGYVAMTHGQSQLVMVNGTEGYVLNLDTMVFGQITSTGWRGSYGADYVDGYFIFVAPNTEQFYISAIDDASSLDALDFSSSDTQPDSIIAHVVFKRELYLFGRVSCEPWVNSGDPDFPLVRYNVAPIEIGIVGRQAFVVADDSIVFVGQTKTGRGYVYQMKGHQPVRISDQAVEEAIAQATDISQIVMWTYQTVGGEFVALHAPGMESTRVWDASTKQWHERAEWDDGWSPLRLDHVCTVGGVQYGAGGAVIYTMDRDTATYAGSEIVLERTWPHLASGSLEPVSYRGLEVACTTGAGRATLEISNDGGDVFGSPLLRSLGATGRRMERIRWLGLGTAIDRVFRLRFYGTAPFALYAAAVDA